MLLKEFFGPAINATKHLSDNSDNTIDQNDELFHFIINHDRLHKDYAMPLQGRLKFKKQDHSTSMKQLMPMVNKGCLEYYHRKKMEGRVEKIFTAELRKKMCQRLFDHYFENIKKRKLA